MALFDFIKSLREKENAALVETNTGLLAECLASMVDCLGAELVEAMRLEPDPLNMCFKCPETTPICIYWEPVEVYNRRHAMRNPAAGNNLGAPAAAAMRPSVRWAVVAWSQRNRVQGYAHTDNAGGALRPYFLQTLESFCEKSTTRVRKAKETGAEEQLAVEGRPVRGRGRTAGIPTA